MLFLNAVFKVNMHNFNVRNILWKITLTFSFIITSNTFINNSTKCVSFVWELIFYVINVKEIL